ncbi:TetR/AcrR family transcriptional regulator [Actinomadura viridis]|uniref:AcrR family transcriptional regulator n=1 Tax=Actinomadura viridis TaxID=58110 RepID=A0A931DLB0_9ACTN|nr:TetR/AcrR family transcriptional regulator [Actinomadura viridis]MBG6089656.1 AcrR family transcriptional regulator [Actinomadura viridis]
MSTTEIPESGARGRTRRAILGAAASVLARDRGATLADIAEAADVGRSTLHRYFPDRRELMNAVVEDSLEAMGRSVAAAAIDDGPPLEAMRRLVAALVDVGDRIMFLWGDPRVLAEYTAHADPGDPECEGDERFTDDPVLRLIERGQAEGVFDPDVRPAWIQHVLWAMVYTGVEDADQGVLPRHGVTATVIRTFENGILARH